MQTYRKREIDSGTWGPVNRLGFQEVRRSISTKKYKTIICRRSFHTVLSVVWSLVGLIFSFTKGETTHLFMIVWVSEVFNPYCWYLDTPPFLHRSSPFILFFDSPHLHPTQNVNVAEKHVSESEK